MNIVIYLDDDQINSELLEIAKFAVTKRVETKVVVNSLAINLFYRSIICRLADLPDVPSVEFTEEQKSRYSDTAISLIGSGLTIQPKVKHKKDSLALAASEICSQVQSWAFNGELS